MESDFDLLALDRKDRQEAIKKVLISSIELKIKLQKQLKALRGKEVIDPEIINSSLRLVNLDNISL